jgi:quinolinate synthase
MRFTDCTTGIRKRRQHKEDSMAVPIPIPDNYRRMSDEACKDLIARRKKELGSKLCLLVHHYQRKEIVPFNDFLGDSYALSAKAAAQKDVRYIVFCGVHFMAEAADILSSDSQRVYMPNPYAGCPMADMAPERQVLSAWEQLGGLMNLDRVVPISYMNSTAKLKAFCGRNGGLICTSSNAHKAFEWAFARGEKIFFFPDEHLGRNTSNRMEIPRSQVLVWNPQKTLGGNTPEQLKQAKVILWQGHCHVHMNYTLAQIDQRRIEYPDIKIVVHPECREDVVDAADAVGSTKFIVKFVDDQQPGTVIAIGTELNLVDRLKDEHPDKTILALSQEFCPMCVNMYRTTLQDLAWTLDVLEKGEANLIQVPESTAAEARLALERMLELE